MGPSAARSRPWRSVVIRERRVVLGLAIGAALTHSLNMFNFPSWVASGQESVTVYRAWSLLQGRDLWGDLLGTSPATTLLLAGWLAVGGAQFGTPFDGGRMLMLILHVAAVALLYGLARQLGCGILGSALAAMLFALSPLVIAHQRLVTADNFVSFWALLGFYLLLRRGGWALRLVGAASLAVGFLSFEAAVAGVPAAEASLQNLVNALNEPLLALGAAATFANVLNGRRDVRAALVGAAGAIAIVRLSFAGAVSSSAFELAVPLCLNVGLAIAPALYRLPMPLAPIATAAIVAVCVLQYGATSGFQPLFSQRPVDAQREALAWTKTHVARESVVEADTWAFPGLADRGLEDISFTGLVRPMLGAGSAEFVLVARDLRPPLDARGPDRSTLGAPSPARAGLVKRWASDGTEVELWTTGRTGATPRALLAGSAQYAARRFERAGAYASLDGTVTSRSQADALLRAVWSDDRAGFTRAWQWTAANLMTSDGLLASTWRNGGPATADTTADADADAALALLFGSRVWADNALFVAGASMVESIWQREIVRVDETPYAVAGDWADEASILALNLGVFTPYAYEVFADVDPGHDWRAVIDSSYAVLAAASAMDREDNPLGLPPDWIGLDTMTGEAVSLGSSNADAIRFGESALLSYWRAGLHLRWSGDARAEGYLRSAGFVQEQVRKRGAPARSYGRDGTILDPSASGTGNAAALAALLTLDPALAQDLFAAQLIGGSNHLASGTYWGDLNDVQAQAWAWLGIALYTDRLPDLWHRSADPVSP